MLGGGERRIWVETWSLGACTLGCEADGGATRDPVFLTRNKVRDMDNGLDTLRLP